VLRVVDALGASAGRYALVSTVSAYRDWPTSPVTEDSAAWPSRLDITEADPDVAPLPEPYRYGTLKAGCELAARTAPGGSLVVRPGVILGPGEYVGRMLTLLNRAARGGQWLVPGPADAPIQPVDVRDVSAFLLDRLAAGDGGLYNLTAPAGYATYGDLIRECIRVTASTATPVWVDPQWLADQGVAQWTEVPLWRMPVGTWGVDSRRAALAGFACRPLAATVADTWEALRSGPPVPHPRQAEHGMAETREKELLQLWEQSALRRG
jgi:nucleoside-diphosphate-sugar epimerase